MYLRLDHISTTETDKNFFNRLGSRDYLELKYKNLHSTTCQRNMIAQIPNFVLVQVDADLILKLHIALLVQVS
jgi:hypothetical protein